MTKKEYCLKGIEDAKNPDHLLKNGDPAKISYYPAINEAWDEFRFSLGSPMSMDEYFIVRLIAIIAQKYPHYSEQDLVSILKLSTAGELGEIFGSPDKNFYLNAYMKWVKVYAIQRANVLFNLERDAIGVTRAQDVGEFLIMAFKTDKLSRQLCYDLYGKLPEDLETPKRYLIT
jgi:hypothetical protein